MSSHNPHNLYVSPLVIWHGVGVSALLTAFAFTVLSRQPETVPLFGLLPISWVVVVGVVSGLLYLTIPVAVRHLTTSSRILIGLIGVGLVSRIVLFASIPLWEIDYFRYLWDGGMLANGFNAYELSPADVLSGQVPSSILLLAYYADGLVEQINYPYLKTIYPPLAESIFAAAHILGEWSLSSWRAVLLVFDLVSLGLLFLLLKELNKSALWVALYWWNPLVIQMFFNAAHMDALLIPFLLAALLFAIRLRPYVSSGFVALAVGIKLWPFLLLPGLLRHRVPSRLIIIRALCLFGVICLVVVLPMVTVGLERDSGLAAFAVSWNTNSALFGTVERAMVQAFTDQGLYELDASRILRAVVACIVFAVAVLVARKPSRNGVELCHRVLMVTVALFLLSPAAYPWYASWVIAFLALSPNAALLVWTATLPLYHLRFHPFFVENPAYFESWIVWLEHGPVMALLLWQWCRSSQGHQS
jgi:alpha-1,6-mannosyltransferase